MIRRSPAVRSLSRGIEDDRTHRALRQLEDKAVEVDSRLNRGPVKVTTPAMPASTVNVKNTTGIGVTAYVAGGTLTDIKVGDVSVGITAAAAAGSAHHIPLTNNQTISITYTVAPTWVWIGT